jgi:hypothetical protein
MMNSQTGLGRDLPIHRARPSRGGVDMLPLSQLGVASYQEERLTEARHERLRRLAVRARPITPRAHGLRVRLGSVLVQVGEAILPADEAAGARRAS